jgi:hypothetical protein
MAVTLSSGGGFDACFLANWMSALVCMVFVPGCWSQDVVRALVVMLSPLLKKLDFEPLPMTFKAFACEIHVLSYSLLYRAKCDR